MDSPQDIPAAPPTAPAEIPAGTGALAAEQLRERVRLLFNLNPDLSSQELEELQKLARLVGRDQFDPLAHEAARLLAAYLGAPVKTSMQELVEEYFGILDRSERLLQEKGEIASAMPLRTSVALVRSTAREAEEWSKIVTRSELPPTLMRAVEACRRRHEVVRSVVEHMLGVLVLIDRDRAIAWMLDYLRLNKGTLDSDVVRDILLAWNAETAPLPREALEWALEWSGDEGLLRQWPYVVFLSDRLLRRQALVRYAQQPRPRHGLLVRLHLMAKVRLDEEGVFRQWLAEAIEEFGRGIDFFGRLSQAETLVDWQSHALCREIGSATELFPLLLMLSDLEYNRPSGALGFAMGFFSLSGQGRQAWDEILERTARRAVKKLMFRYIRENRSPERIIEQLTFGDALVRERLMQKLGIVNRQFQSLETRDAILEMLACYYASYREPGLLAAEITRRYRGLMRMLHDDSLRLRLTQEDYERIRQTPMLPEVAATAGDIRRYLERRRAMDLPLEEMLASEMEFVASIRRRRLKFLIRYLGLSARDA